MPTLLTVARLLGALVGMAASSAIAQTFSNLVPESAPRTDVKREWTLKECVDTRDMRRVRGVYTSSEACFGALSGKNDVLRACVRHPIDFDQSCVLAEGFPSATPLSYAISNVNTEGVRLLLGAGANATSPVNWLLLAASMCTVKSVLADCRDIIRQLLTHGARLDALGTVWGESERKSVAQMAYGRGRLDMLDLMVEAGADINASGGACNLLDAAYIEGDGVRIASLESRGATRSASCAASTDEALARVVVDLPPQSLALPPPPPDPLAGRDWTLEECRQLRSWNHMEPTSASGRDPSLYKAACYGLFHGRSDVVRSCARYPIDFTQTCQRDPYEGPRQPLYFAIERTNVDAVKALLAAGVDVTKPDRWAVPLSGTCNNGKDVQRCRDIVDALIKHGFPINAPISATGSDKGRTLIEMAAGAMNATMLDVLVAAGADINASGASCNALDFAQLGRDAGRIQMLESRGARTSIACKAERYGEFAIKSPLFLYCIFAKCSFH